MTAHQDIVEACEGRSVGAGGWIRANCPRCERRTGKPDRRQCLGYRPSTGRFHCFRCATWGWIPSGDLDRDLAADPIDRRDDDVREVQYPEGFELLFEEPGLSARAFAHPREYLESRGVNEELGREIGIGFVGYGHYTGRVVVPIKSADGNALLGWSARSLYEGLAPKYLYPREMQRRFVLFNHAALLRETESPVFIVEGVFDAISLWPDAVAVLGKPSEEQITALAASRRPLVSLLDGDAWVENERLAVRLIVEGARAAWTRLPPTVDPATFGGRNLLRRRARCFFEDYPRGGDPLEALAAAARLGGNITNEIRIG